MAEPLGPEPLVAVIIPASNEAGKIGRVLDKLPRDGRFEAIVVDDGSTDGTGDEARAHGAAVVFRHEVRGGVGATIRDGWKAGLARDQIGFNAPENQPTCGAGATALLVSTRVHIEGLGMSGAAMSSPGCGPAGAEATVPVKRFRIGRYERKF